MCHRAIRSIVPTLSGRKSVPELRKDLSPYRTCPHCGYRIRTSALEPHGISGENHTHALAGGSGLPEGFMADLLLNNSPTPQMILSDENIVLFANRAAKKMLLFGGSPTSSDERIEEEVIDTSGLLPGEEPSQMPRLPSMGRKGLAELEGARLSDLPLQLADVSARRWISLEAVLSKVKSTLVENSTKQIEEADDAEGWRGINDDYYSAFYEDVRGDSDSREGKQRAERSGSDNRLRRVKSRKRRAANERISTEYIGVTVCKPGEDRITFNVNMFVSVVLPGGGGSVSISQRYVTLSFVPSTLRLLGNDDWDKTSVSSFGARPKERAMDSIADRTSGAPGMSKLGEALVRKVQDMKDQILDDMSVCFISVTPTHDIVLTNRATRELLETDPDRKEVSIHWLKNIEFWREDFSSKIPFTDLVLNTILKEKAIVNQKLGFKTKNGKRRILNLKGKPLWRDEAKKDILAALVVIMDQTEFVSKEKRMKTASRTKTSFLLNVGLGLRAPIAGIVGILEYLYRQTGENLTNEQKTLIRSVFKSVNSLLLVVNDIIDYTRLESGSLRCTNAPFNFTFVMDDVRKLFTTSLRKEDVGFGIDVSQVQVVPPSRKLALLAGEEEEEQDLDLILVGDGRQLRRVLINIIEAAFRYTSEGHVTIKMKTDWTSEDVVRVRFEISDTGVGLTPETIQQIFQPFEKAVSSFEGISGENLGLAVSNALVNAMHGEITCKSIVGVGTTIVINLPFSAPPHGTFVAGSLPGDCLSRTMGIVMRPEEFWVEDDEIAETDTHDDDRKSGHMSLGRKTSFYGPNTGAAFTTTPSVPVHRKTRVAEKASSESEMSGEVGKSEDGKPGYLAEDGDEEGIIEDWAGELTEEAAEADDLEPPMTITSPAPEQEAVIEEGRRVLLVEDNWAHSKIAEKRLKKLGCEVRLATNGHKALLMLRDKIQKPDLIFMDLEMPLLNGYETTHRIRSSPSYEHISNVPVIAVTSVEDPEGPNRALNSGMDGYMLKPLAPDALTQMLQKWTPKQKKLERRRRKKNVKVTTAEGEIRRPGTSSDRKKASEGRSASMRGSDGTKSAKEETPAGSPIQNQYKLAMLNEVVESASSRVSRKTSDDSGVWKNLEATRFKGRPSTKNTVRTLTGILSGSRSPVPKRPSVPKTDIPKTGELDLAKLTESLENEMRSRAESKEYAYMSEEVGLDLRMVDGEPESMGEIKSPTVKRVDSLKPPLMPMRADSLKPPPPPKRVAESAAAQTRVEPKGAFVFPSSMTNPAPDSTDNGELKPEAEITGRKKPSRRQSTQYPTNQEKQQQQQQQQQQLQTGEPQEQRQSVSSAGGDSLATIAAIQPEENGTTERKRRRRPKPSKATRNRLKGGKVETRQASPENSDSDDGKIIMAGTEVQSMIGSEATSPVGARSQSDESLPITGGFPGVW